MKAVKSNLWQDITKKTESWSFLNINFSTGVIEEETYQDRLIHRSLQINVRANENMEVL